METTLMPLPPFELIADQLNVDVIIYPRAAFHLAARDEYERRELDNANIVQAIFAAAENRRYWAQLASLVVWTNPAGFVVCALRYSGEWIAEPEYRVYWREQSGRFKRGADTRNSFDLIGAYTLAELRKNDFFPTLPQQH